MGNIHRCSPRLLCIVLLAIFKFSIEQIADPVYPCYDRSLIDTFYEQPQVPDGVTVTELAERKAIGYSSYCCITGATKSGQNNNRLVSNFPNNTELSLQPNFLHGTTYWINDFLHVGHVHYDMVLIQVLQSTKVDRVILQRAVCHGSLCSGLGVIESFYKGYFAALFAAGGQPHVPVYFRWTAGSKEVLPMYFSNETEDNFYDSHITDPEKKKSIELHGMMCFEKQIGRKNLKFGAIPTLSPRAVQNFKQVAYRMARKDGSLTTYFQRGPPYRILFSYRGPQASRHIENLDEFIGSLQKTFPAPDYVLRLMNNSDPTLTYKDQLGAVAESHVVITNHGAFQGNMLYLRNSSLIIEIFGHYGNNEIHTFHRMAMMFGAYYARVQPMGLQDHYGREYNLSAWDINNILNITKDYFHRQPYLANTGSGIGNTGEIYHGNASRATGSPPDGKESAPSYKLIEDPATGKKLPVTSVEGRAVLQKYMSEALHLGI